MLLRKLFVAALLLTAAFAQNASVTSRGFGRTADLRPSGAFAQKTPVATNAFEPAYRLSLVQPVQDKNFYLLSLFQRNPAVRRLLLQNKMLRQLADEKIAALKKAETCNNPSCFDELLKLDDSAIDTVTAELRKLAGAPAFKLLAKTDLRRSGVFIKYDQQSDAEMLTAAWKDAAAGLNQILGVYGLGKDPRYKDIDKVSFDVSTEAYRNLVRAGIAEIKLPKELLFFEPTLNFALKLLEINRRDEAGRYEPLERGENRAAVRNLSRIKWSDYPYSFILVLGSGGRDLSTRISPIGAQRTDVGAQLFLQHKAPLIIVSGGHVHPIQTPYCEAIEMKKYLIEKYKIPERNILVEPHARHTTSNFRNGARLAFRYRIPTAKALVTSSEDHITYVLGDEFRTRCLNEFGYLPFDSIKRVSPVEAEFKPSVTSLFFDANDPLDP